MKRSIKILLSFSLVFIMTSTKVFANNKKQSEVVSDEIIDISVEEELEMEFPEAKSEELSNETTEEYNVEELDVDFHETESEELLKETVVEEKIEVLDETLNNKKVDHSDDEVVGENNHILREETRSSIILNGTNGKTTWEFDSDGLLRISPVENTNGMMVGPEFLLLDKNLVKSIEVTEGVKLPNNAVSTFSKYPNVEKIHFDNTDTSNVTSMSDLFADNPKLTDINIGNWDVSNVTNMSRMFKNAKSLKSLDLSGWSTNSLKLVPEMFIRAESLTDLNINAWDVSKVTSTASMLDGARGLTSLDLSLWDVSSVENMSEMFSNTHSLKNLDLSNWTPTSATNMSRMFENAKSLESLSVSDWDVSSVRNIASMFSGLEKMEELDISSWNVSNVESMRHLFSGSTALKEINIKEWTPVSVTNTTNMFENTSSIKSLDLSGWKLTNLTDMTFMFNNMTSLESLNVTGWEFSKPINMVRTFYNLKSLKSLDLGTWTVPIGSNLLYIFGETPLETLTLSSSFKFGKYQDFPEITPTDKYSGSWVNIAEPHKVFDSSKSFLKEFSSEDAGTYIRQEKYSIKYIVEENASHDNELFYKQYEGIAALKPAIKANQSFIGWFDENSNLISSIPKNLNRDITLTAKFLNSVYSITYILDGGINHEDNPASYKVGEGVSEFKPSSKHGYDFVGWFDKNDHEITSIDNATTGDVTLHAKYEAKEYKIIYDLDGGINHKKNPTSYVYGEGVDLFFNATKENYKFMGWFDAEGHTVQSILNNDFGDRVLKAVWKEDKIDDKDQEDAKEPIGDKEKTPGTGLENFTNLNIFIILFASFVLFVVAKLKKTVK